MDRDRLKEVHQSEITESRINEDFLAWLKTKGPSWLLAGLVAVGAYMGVVRWKQHRTGRTDEAWRALLDARLPGAKEDVADEHPETFAVPQLAWLEAADLLLTAVTSGRPLGTDLIVVAALPLSVSERQDYLSRAARLCEKVLATDTEQTLAMTLHAVDAMKGLAAVAESRGDADEARRWFLAAADRAEPYYPPLAEQARGRAETVDDFTELVVLPTTAQTTALGQPEPLAPILVVPTLRPILLPDEFGGR